MRNSKLPITRIKPVVLILASFFLIITIATANAQKVESHTKQRTSEVGEGSVLVSNEDSSYQKGRRFLDYAWAALDDGNEKLAVRFFAIAERHFSEALEDSPEDIPTLMNRATAYVGLEEYALALGDFDKILVLDPAYAPGFEGKALTYNLMGDTEKAEEMQEAADAIYQMLASQGEETIEPDNQPSPDSLYGTWYASNARHNYRNRFTGQTTINASGFGCGVTQPWKTNVENAVYFNLPWNTWGRYTEGFKCTGLCNWVNLSGNTQGYTNAPPFNGWTVPAGENYVLLISESEVCAAFWAPIQ